MDNPLPLWQSQKTILKRIHEHFKTHSTFFLKVGQRGGKTVLAQSFAGQWRDKHSKSAIIVLSESASLIRDSYDESIDVMNPKVSGLVTSLVNNHRADTLIILEEYLWWSIPPAHIVIPLEKAGFKILAISSGSDKDLDHVPTLELATWEMSPDCTFDTLRDKYDADFDRACRDFGKPPLWFVNKEGRHVP